MKIVIFVHDLHLEIGHSRALIELLNGLDQKSKDQITEIETVSFTSTSLDKLFPDFKAAKKIIKLPFNNLRPTLLKIIFYHIYSFIYAAVYCRKKIKIGIGIASLKIDIANIQFVHDQWRPLYFKDKKLNPVSWLYKKVLFFYFSVCEKIVFSNKKTKLITIANYIQKHLVNKYNINPENCVLIPSGVNLNEFSLPLNQETAWEELQLEYPQIEKLNKDLPIFLFAGAFERKGLQKALNYLKNKPNIQLIIIGKAEVGSIIEFPPSIHIIKIPFTKKINLFYSISDIFIFPTFYEPFGLVIIEAFAMGLDLIIPADNVGASEIIHEGPGIYYFKQCEEIPFINFEKISTNIRLERRKTRLASIEKYTWRENSKKFQAILFKN